ncbi:MAG: DUF4136 domain-containing protein [Lentisphaerae bacterium]|nr:DUF4136 domain-containing protein [Lentisphaerota bacterium]
MRLTGLTILAPLVFSAFLMGCRTDEEPTAAGPIEGVTNPSVEVLFDNTRALPVTGTFGWGISLLRVDPALNVSLSEVEERLHQSLLSALPGEGFVFTNTSPDYLVGFAVLAGASLDEAELNRSYGDLLAFPARTGAAPALNYSAGVLIVDIVESAHSHLLWRGAIKADIDMQLPTDRKQARCDGAIRELLRHYPSPPATGK